MSEYVIEMRNITKSFFGNVANDNITLQLRKGEIHALLGENGAGKSTLMSILFGLYQKDSGEIYKDGEKVEINSPNDATALHIGMVHQHFKLVECFSVLDNIIYCFCSCKHLLPYTMPDGKNFRLPYSVLLGRMQCHGLEKCVLQKVLR